MVENKRYTDGLKLRQLLLNGLRGLLHSWSKKTVTVHRLWSKTTLIDDLIQLLHRWSKTTVKHMV